MLVLLSIFGVSFVAAEEKHEHKLTAKEAKALVANAKTPEDHLKIAAFYRNEAQKQEEKAKYHDEMAELYKNHPTGKVGAEMQGHCKLFADAARKAAESDKQLAAEHERMAEELRQAK
jgi:hypothetical protein